MARPGQEENVASALAVWLSDRANLGDQPTARGRYAWDLIDLAGVDARDQLLSMLLTRLAEQSHVVYARPSRSCWRVELPATWDEYLARLSKSHRKQVRRAERRLFDAGRARLHRVEHAGEVAPALDLRADLTERRRANRSGSHCFSSPRFKAFQRRVASDLLDAGLLRFYWLELDGRAVAAEYQIVEDGVVYAYQGGIEPDALAHSPGQLITLATLRHAVADGCRGYDFLCGDEPYKAHWRAQPQPQHDIRVVHAGSAAHWRQGLWFAKGNLKQWITGLRRGATRAEEGRAAP